MRVLPNTAADCGARPGSGQWGFTLIELVTVMVIVGIMAVVVAPRFADNTFNQRGFHDAAKAAIQHARRSAVASRRYQCVTINAGVLSIQRDTTKPELVGTISCTEATPFRSSSSGCVANQVCAPAGVTIVGPGLIFDPQGRLVTAPNTVSTTAATITISGAADITVAPETGYIQ